MSPSAPSSGRGAPRADPDEVERLRRQLEATEREFDAFLHTITHDLNGPLRTIEGFTHILLQRHRAAMDAEVLDHVERVHAASEEMAGLIQALHELAQVTRAPMSTESVDLSALARGAARRLAESEPGRKVDVRVQDGLVARGDPALVSIAVANLLSNAWKFTRAAQDARIEVGAETTRGERVLFVRDNGVGFDTSRKDRLFQPFGRLHDPAAFEGAGVGLAAVQRIVRRHGGRVWAEGSPGRGATFYFTLGV